MKGLLAAGFSEGGLTMLLNKVNWEFVNVVKQLPF